jgi:hypothetical protein
MFAQFVCVSLETQRRYVFVVVAFPPPPVTFPATRLTVETMSGIAPIRLFLSE